MNDLTFENVSKRYVVRQETEADLTLHPWLRKVKALRTRKESFWALRGVSFEVKRGETLGIIGHNGAGKSTILKLLSGITTPTSGNITIEGRLSALIEVGSGFHPELTGRENIFLNGAILGMSKQEIAAKLDSIVDFAGVRPFLDVPVKRFSSGMYVRLGFSIAAHLDPDILLLDEVLAVGDAAFQEKCLNRIAELKRANTTIVFISHDLGAVERICDRVVLMRRGEVDVIGDPASVIHGYQSSAVDSRDVRLPVIANGNRGDFSTALTFNADSETPGIPIQTGSPVTATIAFVSNTNVADVVFEILFRTADMNDACELSTGFSSDTIDLQPGAGSITFSCPALCLQPGLYFADVVVRAREMYEGIHANPRAATMRVDPGVVTRGEFYQPQSWRLAWDEARDRGCATGVS